MSPRLEIERLIKCGVPIDIASKLGAIYRARFPLRTFTYEAVNEFTQEAIAVTLDSKIQKKQAEAYTNNVGAIHPHAIIGVGSIPNDIPAMYFGVQLLHQYMLMGSDTPESPVLAFNVSDWDRRKRKCYDLEHTVRMVMIYNLGEFSDYQRIQACRDIMDFFSSSIRIIVLAGVNPLQFFHERLHHRFTDLFLFSLNIRTEV